MSGPIFKIVPERLWRAAEADGLFTGAPVDHSDGYIHFSGADQVRETAAKYFAGERDLLLVAVDPAALGDALRWEPSRSDALFPHLYAPLDPARVLWVAPLPLDGDGRHDFAGLLP